MSTTIRHLPVVQNWDCHVCGTCCKEYQITITDEEKKRIEAQGWDRERDLGGLPMFKTRGPFWARRYQLNHRDDGSCVFLSEQGRCRIHERHGYETKPLPCRLFPYVLVPVADHWRVGMRFACPSAAANKGRAVADQDKTLREFAELLARREKLDVQPDGSRVPPPRLGGGQRVGWSSVVQLTDVVMALLRDRRDRVERRLRKCLALASLCRPLRYDRVQGTKLAELLQVLSGGLDADVPADPASLSPPSWVGKVLFRQAAALYTRKDHGPNRGLAARGRAALLRAAAQFARGTGPVPRMHGWLPETTFEELEKPLGPLPKEAALVLERYYVLKVGSLQFCGPASFGLPFWEGLESLALTYPILMWVTRAFAARSSPADGLLKALSIVDDHFGFNRVLGTMRQRISFRILASTGELAKLIAWYSR